MGKLELWLGRISHYPITMIERARSKMSGETKGLRVRRFFELEARALEDSYKVIETLLPSAKNKGAAHPAEEGRYRVATQKLP